MTGVFPDLPPEILDRVEALREGRTLLQLPHHGVAPPVWSDELSPRETDVLALIADGLTDQEVGDRLEIAIDTVKTHVKHILRKLHVQNRAHAVAQGFRQGDLV